MSCSMLIPTDVKGESENVDDKGEDDMLCDLLSRRLVNENPHLAKTKVTHSPYLVLKPKPKFG